MTMATTKAMDSTISTTVSSSTSSCGIDGGGTITGVDTIVSDEQKHIWKVEVYTAYIQPLRKKYDIDQLVTYEDLTSSWQAANAAIGKISSSSSASAIQEYINILRVDIGALHKGQMAEYQETAKKSLLDWCEKWEIPTLTTIQSSTSNSNMTLEMYIKAVEVTARQQQPVWRITKANASVLEAVQRSIRERATKLYNTKTQTTPVVPTSTSTSTTTPPLKAEGEKMQSSPARKQLLQSVIDTKQNDNQLTNESNQMKEDAEEATVNETTMAEQDDEEKGKNNDNKKEVEDDDEDEEGEIKEDVGNDGSDDKNNSGEGVAVVEEVEMSEAGDGYIEVFKDDADDNVNTNNEDEEGNEGGEEEEGGEDEGVEEGEEGNVLENILEGDEDGEEEEEGDATVMEENATEETETAIMETTTTTTAISTPQRKKMTGTLESKTSNDATTAAVNNTTNIGKSNNKFGNRNINPNTAGANKKVIGGGGNVQRGGKTQSVRGGNNNKQTATAKAGGGIIRKKGTTNVKAPPPSTGTRPTRGRPRRGGNA